MLYDHKWCGIDVKIKRPSTREFKCSGLIISETSLPNTFTL